LRNLLILVSLWITSSFDYYLLNYQMKNIEGNIFLNNFVSFMCQVPAQILGGILYKKIGIRFTFSAFFTVAVAGAVGLLVIPIGQVSLVPIFILLGKSGVSGTFNICYLANAQIFPAIFAGTAFGICNIGAKLATILAPLIAETNQPIPGITFAATATLAAFLSLLLVVDANPKEEKKVEE
jgi:OCT family organic cation transporter-like MFS transporter 4/5